MQKKWQIALTVGVSSMLLVLNGCDTSMHVGDAPTIATGSSSTVGETEAAVQLVHCDKPLGTAALVESEYTGIAQSGTTSPMSLLRLMMQQSNCFLVVDRGQAMRNIMRERDLEKTGELRSGSDFSGGQIVAADFSITPNVTYKQKNAHGRGAGLGLITGLAGAPFVPGGSFLALGSGLVGAVGLGANTTTGVAQSTISITDNRSAIQIADAEGSASKEDVAGVLVLFGSYTNTDADKIVAASLMDAYNKMVASVQSSGYAYKPQPAAALLPQQAK
jgi:hypothetical protein